GAIEKQGAPDRRRQRNQRSIRNVLEERIPGGDLFGISGFSHDTEGGLVGEVAQKLSHTAFLIPKRSWIDAQTLIEQHIVGFDELVGDERNTDDVGVALKSGFFDLVDLRN